MWTFTDKLATLQFITNAAFVWVTWLILDAKTYLAGPKLVWPDHVYLANIGPARPFFIQNQSGLTVFIQTIFLQQANIINLVMHRDTTFCIFRLRVTQSYWLDFIISCDCDWASDILPDVGIHNHWRLLAFATNLH